MKTEKTQVQTVSLGDAVNLLTWYLATDADQPTGGDWVLVHGAEFASHVGQATPEPSQAMKFRSRGLARSWRGIFPHLTRFMPVRRSDGVSMPSSRTGLEQ